MRGKDTAEKVLAMFSSIGNSVRAAAQQSARLVLNIGALRRGCSAVYVVHIGCDDSSVVCA